MAVPSVDLKLRHQPTGITRKVVLPLSPVPSWSRLASSASDRFNIDVDRLGLRYIDRDGDLISLSSQVELDELWTDILSDAKTKNGSQRPFVRIDLIELSPVASLAGSVVPVENVPEETPVASEMTEIKSLAPPSPVIEAQSTEEAMEVEEKQEEEKEGSESSDDEWVKADSLSTSDKGEAFEMEPTKKEKGKERAPRSDAGDAVAESVASNVAPTVPVETPPVQRDADHQPPSLFRTGPPVSFFPSTSPPRGSGPRGFKNYISPSFPASSSSPPFFSPANPVYAPTVPISSVAPSPAVPTVVNNVDDPSDPEEARQLAEAIRLSELEAEFAEEVRKAEALEAELLAAKKAEKDVKMGELEKWAEDRKVEEEFVKMAEGDFLKRAEEKKVEEEAEAARMKELEKQAAEYDRTVERMRDQMRGVTLNSGEKKETVFVEDLPSSEVGDQEEVADPVEEVVQPTVIDLTADDPEDTIAGSPKLSSTDESPAVDSPTVEHPHTQGQEAPSTAEDRARARAGSPLSQPEDWAASGLSFLVSSAASKLNDIFRDAQSPSSARGVQEDLWGHLVEIGHRARVAAETTAAEWKEIKERAAREGRNVGEGMRGFRAGSSFDGGGDFFEDVRRAMDTENVAPVPVQESNVEEKASEQTEEKVDEHKEQEVEQKMDVDAEAEAEAGVDNAAGPQRAHSWAGPRRSCFSSRHARFSTLASDNDVSGGDDNGEGHWGRLGRRHTRCGYSRVRALKEKEREQERGGDKLERRGPSPKEIVDDLRAHSWGGKPAEEEDKPVETAGESGAPSWGDAEEPEIVIPGAWRKKHSYRFGPKGLAAEDAGSKHRHHHHSHHRQHQHQEEGKPDGMRYQFCLSDGPGKTFRLPRRSFMATGSDPLENRRPKLPFATTAALHRPDEGRSRSPEGQGRASEEAEWPTPEWVDESPCPVHPWRKWTPEGKRTPEVNTADFVAPTPPTTFTEAVPVTSAAQFDPIPGGFPRERGDASAWAPGVPVADHMATSYGLEGSTTPILDLGKAPTLILSPPPIRYGVPGGFDHLSRRPSVLEERRRSSENFPHYPPEATTLEYPGPARSPLVPRSTDSFTSSLREDTQRQLELERLRHVERLDHQHRLELQMAREQWDREAESLREAHQLMRAEYETMRRESDQRAAEAQSEVRALQMQMQELLSRPRPMEFQGGRPWGRRPPPPGFGGIGFDPRRPGF